MIREVNLTGAQLLGIEWQLLTDKSFTRIVADADDLKILSVNQRFYFNVQVFTTKDLVKGIGAGLPLSKTIIEKT
ncbi:MAG: hypothetical protein H7X83_00860 [Verrucomicrobia bacterium]|nr:hypothetical protein [Deltaproteobacteria bacterium]